MLHKKNLIRFSVGILGVSIGFLMSCGPKSKENSDNSSLPPPGASYVAAKFNFISSGGTTGDPTFTVICPGAYATATNPTDTTAWYQTGITPGGTPGDTANNNLILITKNANNVDVTCYVFMTQFVTNSGTPRTYTPATGISTPPNTQPSSFPAGFVNGSYTAPGSVAIPSFSTGNMLSFSTTGMASAGVTYTTPQAFQYNADNSSNSIPVITYLGAQVTSTGSAYTVQLNYSNNAPTALTFTKTNAPIAAVSFTASNIPAPVFNTSASATTSNTPFQMQNISLNNQRAYSVYQTNGAGSTLFNATDCLIILADAASVSTTTLATNAFGAPTTAWSGGSSATGATNVWASATGVTSASWFAGLSGGSTAWNGTASVGRTITQLTNTAAYTGGISTFAQANAVYNAIVGTSGVGNNFYPYSTDYTGAAYTGDTARASRHGVYACTPGTNAIPRNSGSGNVGTVSTTPVAANWGTTNSTGVNPQTDTFTLPGYYNHDVIILYANTVSGLTSYTVVFIPQQTN